ncbi:MAG: sigma-70 family RNA polymerase sigma factor [Planctomycetota bacterium]|nr:sigma-70 family RNA polymerase sigma factor [Planctomycetota bacterium]
MSDPAHREEAVERLAEAGDDRGRVLAELFERHRQRLLRMIDIRMDPRLRMRVGASDVLQDAFVEVSQRVATYLANPDMPFFLWIRFITAQRLMALHRFHFKAQKRDLRRQQRYAPGAVPEATSVALVDHLAASGTMPAERLLRAEARLQLQHVLDSMHPTDREVLVLRHFEGLTNVETALALGIDTSAASKRHVRALEHLRSALAELEAPDLTEGS